MFWNCEGTILLDVMQRGGTVNSDANISMIKKNEESVSSVFDLSRTCMICCFSTIMQGLPPLLRLGKPSRNLEGPCYCIHHTAPT